MLDFNRQAETAALKDGVFGLQLAGDMTWALPGLKPQENRDSFDGPGALLKMYFTGQPSLMNVIRGSGRLRVRD
jgi:hypothetical protein